MKVTGQKEGFHLLNQPDHCRTWRGQYKSDIPMLNMYSFLAKYVQYLIIQNLQVIFFKHLYQNFVIGYSDPE